jgi:hypothetical protein
MRTRFVTLALASGLALPAQTSVQPASPFRFAPADAALVLRVAAPAKWKDQFAKTQFAKLLGGPTLAPHVAQLDGLVTQALDGMRQGGSLDADLVEKLLLEYKGEIVVAVTVDWDGLAGAMMAGEPPGFGVAIAFTPDGSYDLGKLVAAVEKVAEEQAPADALRDLQVGDVRLRYSKNGDEPDASIPTLVEGHMVALISDDLDKFAKRALDGKTRFTASADPVAPGATMHAHLQLAPLMKALAAAAGDSGAPFDAGELLEKLGFMALDAFDLSVGSEGKHVAVDGALRLQGKERGLFGALLAPGTQPVKMLRLVPPGADTFSVGQIDFGALLTTVGNVWTMLDDVVPMTWEDAQAGFADALKVRLKEDLFDHLGTEMLTVQDLPEGAAAGDEDPLGGFSGTCFGVALKNGKAFGDAVEKALRARGLHAARKTEDYQQVQVHRLRLAGVVEIEYAITDDLLLLAIGSGEQSRQSLRSVLDARANPPATTELAAPVKERLALLPADWTSLSVTSVADMLKIVGTTMEQAMQQAMDEAPEELGAMLGVLQQVRGDLERLGLQTMVSIGHVTANGGTFRVRW